MASNKIGDNNPIVGGYSTAYNNEAGQGAHNPLGKGNKNPSGTKPAKPAGVRVSLNATGKK